MKFTSAAIRATNITCFDDEVRLFYSGFGKYRLGTITSDKVFKIMPTTASNWGSTLLNADGTVWVSDNATFPFAFGNTLAITSKFVYGAYLSIVTINTSLGKPIETVFREIVEAHAQDLLANVAFFTTIEQARGLNGASPIGFKMNYNESNLKINVITCNNTMGSSFQSLTIPGYLPETGYNPGNLPGSLFFQSNDLGWNIAVVVVDLQNDDYIALVNSLLNQPLFIDELRQYSVSTDQLTESLEFIYSDASGNAKRLIDTQVVDPYQAQPTLDSHTGILLAGQTYCQVKMLAGESLELRIVVEEGHSGITYDDLKSLDALLAEQGVDTVIQEELLELKETWNNFDGFKKEKNKSNKSSLKLVILGLITLLIIK